MYQSAKSKTGKAIGAFIGVCKVLGMVLAIVSAAIIVVPVGAGALVAWAAGVIFDALRPKRTGENLVRSK